MQTNVSNDSSDLGRPRRQRQQRPDDRLGINANVSGTTLPYWKTTAIPRAYRDDTAGEPWHTVRINVVVNDLDNDYKTNAQMARAHLNELRPYVKEKGDNTMTKFGMTMIVAAGLMGAVSATAPRCEAQTTQPAAAGKVADDKQLVLELANRVPMKLVLIPAGKFLMGSPANEVNRDLHSDETQHEVTLTKSFYMGVTEVTQAQYQAVMGAHASRFKGPTLPVEPVTWVDAVEFCKKVSEKTGKTVRLPTEAEWEFACRAGTTTPYAGTGNLMEMGWYGGNSNRTTHPVARKKPNAWGLYDMHGNVWEWCSDWFGPYSGNATDPQGVSQETANTMRTGAARIMRGGCWTYDEARLRSASRGRGSPTNPLTGPGFRVVVDTP